jgi:hypothetical protein
MTSRILGLLATTAILAGVANAAVVQVDVNSDPGSPAPAGWNALDDPVDVIDDLLDTEGSATGIGIETSGWTDSGRGGYRGSYAEVAAEDYFFIGGGSSATVTLTVTNAAESYIIEIWSSRSGGPGPSDWTVNGSFGDATDTDNNIHNGDDFDAVVNGYNGADIMTFSGVTADGSNQIVISATARANYGLLNAIRVTEVPEPATMSVLGLGGLVLLRRRKRA